jgi:hypothetical protein
MTHHVSYDLALQEVQDRATRRYTRPPEPVLRRRAARTLRRLADGLDGGDPTAAEVASPA